MNLVSQVNQHAAGEYAGCSNAGPSSWERSFYIGGAMRSIAGIAAGSVVVGLMVTGTVASGQESDTKTQAELASALAAKHISLQTGLTRAASKGRPISAKYEYEDGKLKLSVYTEKRGQFFEVTVNNRSGQVVKTEKITDGDDLRNAEAQSSAIAKAKESLKAAVGKAVADNPGYRAVSVTPSLNAGKASAEVTLLRGRAFKTVTEPLA